MVLSSQLGSGSSNPPTFPSRQGTKKEGSSIQFTPRVDGGFVEENVLPGGEGVREAHYREPGLIECAVELADGNVNCP